MKREGPLLVIEPDGTCREVPNTYEGIKDGLGQATLDFVALDREIGFYVDDEGMLDRRPLNVAASMFAARPLFGPVVMCRGLPDDEGDTVPVENPKALASMKSMADRWRIVIGGGRAIGQSIEFLPNPDTIPPPQVIGLDEEALARWLETGETP